MFSIINVESVSRTVWSIVADRTAQSIIGYWHHSVVWL